MSVEDLHIAPEVEEGTARVLCARCYSLSHYGCAHCAILGRTLTALLYALQKKHHNHAFPCVFVTARRTPMSVRGSCMCRCVLPVGIHKGFEK